MTHALYILPRSTRLDQMIIGAREVRSLTQVIHKFKFGGIFADDGVSWHDGWIILVVLKSSVFPIGFKKKIENSSKNMGVSSHSKKF